MEVESCPGRDTLAALKLIAIDRRSPLVQRIHDGEYQRGRKWAEVLKFSPLCFIYFFFSVLFYFLFPSISSFFSKYYSPFLTYLFFILLQRRFHCLWLLLIRKLKLPRSKQVDIILLKAYPSSDRKRSERNSREICNFSPSTLASPPSW